MKNYILIVLITFLISSTFGGFWGYNKAELKYKLQISELQESLALEQIKHQTKVRTLEYQLQEQQAYVSKQILEIKQQTETDIRDLNIVIDNYRLQLKANHTEFNRLSDAAKSQCRADKARANKWHKAFIELSELSKDLATERDEIAKKKNLLVETYNQIRDQINAENLNRIGRKKP